MELIEKMEELKNLLNLALKEFKTRGIEYAKCYKDYRIKVAQKLLELKANEMPVTLAYDIARRRRGSSKSKRNGNSFGDTI